MVLRVRFEVLGQIAYPFAQDSHLHFGRTRVRIVQPVTRDKAAFVFLGQRHTLFVSFKAIEANNLPERTGRSKCTFQLPT
jgi:hypothetical protein